LFCWLYKVKDNPSLLSPFNLVFPKPKQPALPPTRIPFYHRGKRNACLSCPSISYLFNYNYNPWPEKEVQNAKNEDRRQEIKEIGIKEEAFMRKNAISEIGRREFLRTSALGLTAFSTFSKYFFAENQTVGKTTVSLVKTQDRARGVKEVMRLLQFPSPSGKSVFIKPNFNTSDPTPGSTHNDTLRQLVQEMKARGARQITLGESSGPPPTKKVMEDKGIPGLAKDMGFDIINFEDLGDDGWTHFNPPGNHWKDGFDIAKAAAEAEYLVSTCCLKTHQFGGVFTMSLKLAVGLTPKAIRRELHGKRDTDMRKMIAELNLAYKPKVIVMDGVEVFVDGGPSSGKKVEAGVFVGGTDRVAVDAVGVAILKELGSNQAIMSKKIFEQDQIGRAVEIGLGIGGPEQIEFATPDKASRDYAEKIKGILAQG
jgi:uncharacterized protein (DUF362 family)